MTAAAALVGFLVTYPYFTLTVLTLAYLAMIPFSYRRSRQLQKEWDRAHPADSAKETTSGTGSATSGTATSSPHTSSTRSPPVAANDADDADSADAKRGST
jgi:hypothetical protein